MAAGEDCLNKMDPLREKKEKILCRGKEDGLALIYEWTKTGVINKAEFIKLIYHHMGIWSL